MPLKEMESWYRIKISVYPDQVSNEWLEGNIKHRYKNFGLYHWYFKDKGDAATFALRWKGV